jgi:hypothetical protein
MFFSADDHALESHPEAASVEKQFYFPYLYQNPNGASLAVKTLQRYPSNIIDALIFRIFSPRNSTAHAIELGCSNVCALLIIVHGMRTWCDLSLPRGIVPCYDCLRGFPFRPSCCFISPYGDPCSWGAEVGYAS